jgi:hypothetical protein
MNIDAIFCLCVVEAMSFLLLHIKGGNTVLESEMQLETGRPK